MNTPNPARLRVAIVGAGYVAAHHLAALKRLDFVELVGICDPNLEAARALAARFGIERVAADLAGLADAKPQVVHVLTPPASHAALALQAFEMGCGVLVEKPIAITQEQAQDIANHAAAAGVFCMEAFWTLFLPKYDVLAQVLADEACEQIGLRTGAGRDDQTHRLVRPAVGQWPLGEGARPRRCQRGGAGRQAGQVRQGRAAGKGWVQG